MVVDKDTAPRCNLQWARILVKSNGRKVPTTIQVVVGLLSFYIHLWWENPPRVILVDPKRNCTRRRSETMLWGPHTGRRMVLDIAYLERDGGYMLWGKSRLLRGRKVQFF